MAIGYSTPASVSPGALASCLKLRVFATVFKPVAALEQEVQAFWDQFKPGIECVGVEVQGTDEITLADIEPYQRFDADGVSFEDNTSAIPPTADMTA